MGTVNYDFSSISREVGMKVVSILLVACGIVATSFYMVGCGGGRQTYVKPSVYALPVQDGQAMGSAKYPFPHGMGPGRMEVYFQGMGVRKVSGYPQPSLRIQVSCDNQSEKPLIFDTTESHLVDNRGDVLRCSGAWRDGAAADSFEQVQPASHAQFDLFFDLRQGYPLEKVDSFKVYWRYKSGERSVCETTMFLKQPTKNMFYEDADGKRKNYNYFMAIAPASHGGGRDEQ